MKFNKKINKIAEKYHYYIPYEYWFNYKGFKKILKDILQIRLNYVMMNIQDCNNEDCCCVCLENDNLIKTFCCKNSIHHVCLFRVLSSDIGNCPMCRAELLKVLKFSNNREFYDAKIISLISIIHININNIEAFIKRKVIKEKYLPIYIEYNRQAIVKMCKKIDKNLHINCQPFFIELMNKHGILIEQTKKPQKDNIANTYSNYNVFRRLYILFKRIMTNI